MALIVKKFGGSSVATPDKMRAIVQRVLKGKKPEDKIVIVVSAMGDTTDDLVTLAKQITSKTYGREMDMLLTTGEQVSIALMAMAFQEAGQKAISFTGAQAGIKTSDSFNKGRILALKPGRIMKALDQGNIVVVAGFQGITGLPGRHRRFGPSSPQVNRGRSQACPAQRPQFHGKRIRDYYDLRSRLE